MKEFNDDFFDDLKQKLLEHEEPYREGAWEQFAEKAGLAERHKPATKVIPLWKWLGAAAAVALGALFLISVLNKKQKNNNIPNGPVVKTESPAIAPAADSNTAQAAASTTDSQQRVNHNITLIKPERQQAGSTVIKDPLVKDENEQIIISKQQPPIIQHKPQIVQNPPVFTRPANENVVVQPLKEKQQTQTVEQPRHFYENQIVPNKGQEEVAKTQKVEQQQRDVVKNNAPGSPSPKLSGQADVKKWQSSVFVSPTMSDKVNVGLGYELGYAINDKFTVSSGLAYNKMSNVKNVGSAPQPSTIAASQNPASLNSFARQTLGYTAAEPQRTLESVRGVITGVDMPLDLKYKVSKKVYASAGVSGMVVLKDAPEYTYLQNNQQRFTIRGGNDGAIAYDNTGPALSNGTNTVSVPLNEQVQKTAPVLGFYNFSLGFKQKVSRKNSVSLEPFVKLPMKKSTKDAVNYLGTGIKVKLDL